MHIVDKKYYRLETAAQSNWRKYHRPYIFLQMNSENDPVSAWESKRYNPKPGEPKLPPQLSDMSQKSAQDIIDELNRMPFFMNQLDETNGQGGENTELEALKSLMYDGNPDEIATNFKNQGNECYKTKQYKDAVQFYTKGLEMDCGRDEINVALYINRAACNLELKNFRRCIDDCKKALSLDNNNVKACYRAGKALFLVERYKEAKEVLQYGLSIDTNNAALKEMLEKTIGKMHAMNEARRQKEEEQYTKKRQENVLLNAIKLRHIQIVKSSRPPALLEDAKIRLEDPSDHESQLIFPAMILYPTIDEFDFIAEISELSTPADIVSIITDRSESWFNEPKHRGFTAKSLECYMETISGGLVKVGKKASINTALMSDAAKAPLFDKALRLYIVPKADAPQWLKSWDKEDAMKKRSI